jgi:hypothetical protein
MADRKLMSESDRLAVCAEILELVRTKSQPDVADYLGTSQTSISKALRRGVVGPGIADDLVEKLGTTREALRKKHAAVVSGKTEPPWETWAKMNRKRGNRTDLLAVAEKLAVPALRPPQLREVELEGARAIMLAWGWPIGAIASAEKNCQVSDPRMDSSAIATMWDRWLRRPPTHARSTEHAESHAPGPPRSSRPAGR